MSGGLALASHGVPWGVQLRDSHVALAEEAQEGLYHCIR